MDVRVVLLGGFSVRLGERVVASDAWPSRRAAELVQLLSLAPSRRLTRDQAVDALWPHLAPEAGAANLRKAAHHVRQVLGEGSLPLRAGVVSLLPDHEVHVDVVEVEAAGRAALGGPDPTACAAAARSFTGVLLPDALYEEWNRERRDALTALQLALLRGSLDWPAVLALDPTDEDACAELMTGALARGQRHTALRAYGRLLDALERELGVRPGPQVGRLYDACVAGLRAEAPALVGRQVPLARARAALDGQVAALVVRGPGGIGKSALCAALATGARQQGRRVVLVTVSPESGSYAPLSHLVQALVVDDRSLLDGLDDRTRTVLSGLTPLVPVGADLDGPVTRHQVVGAVARLLGAAGSAGRLLVVVDDAHLADDDSVEALLALAGPRAAVLLACRPGAAGSRLGAGVARLQRAGTAEVLELAPLDDTDAAALVMAVARPDEAALRRVLRGGEGNPLLLLELARSAGTSTLSEAVAIRLVDLDDGSRAVVQRLAVAGESLALEDVLAVMGTGESEACALLDAALAAGVLVVSGTRYRFRHELVRQALAEQVPPHRRVAVHRDAARNLAEAGGAPASVAHHWLQGGRPRQAVPWLREAARRSVALGAFADALARLDLLLEHAPADAEALALRAHCLEARGDDRAPAAYAAAARVLPEGSRDELLAKQALASVRAGDPAGAVAVLDGVRATTLEGRLAQSLAVCGAAAMGFADPDVGVAMAVETRALAIASGDRSAMVIASWAEAAAAHVKGDLPRTMRSGMRETYALPDVAVTVFDGQLCVAERLLYGGQPYAEVLAFTDALEAEADRLGAARGKAFAVTFRGEALLLTGRLEQAQSDLTRGVQLHRDISASGGEALSLERLAALAVLRGDRPLAHDLLDEALDVARSSNLGFHLLDRIYGTRIAAADGPAAGLAAVEEAETAVQGSLETCPGCRINLAVPAALAAAAAGDAPRARRYEATAVGLTTLLMRLPGWYAAVEEVRAHRARADGDAAAFSAHLSRAAAGFRDVGQPLDAARCAQALSAG